MANNSLKINQQKKLQNYYNNYRVITEKINKTLTKIHKVETANSKIAPTKAEPLQAAEERPTCSGCREDQPNQQAHMGPGGCLDDTPDWLKDEEKEGDDEVPDNWDDDL